MTTLYFTKGQQELNRVLLVFIPLIIQELARYPHVSMVYYNYPSSYVMSTVDLFCYISICPLQVHSYVILK